MNDIPANKIPRLVGMNHIALAVGNIDEALEFYGRLFDFSLRGRGDGRAFIDMGDQFIALFEEPKHGKDSHRHIGLVVDDKQAARARLEKFDVPISSGPFLDFLDPWGNRIQIIDYADIQFTKAPEILRGMELHELDKSPDALRQLREKGMAPVEPPPGIADL